MVRLWPKSISLYPRQARRNQLLIFGEGGLGSSTSNSPSGGCFVQQPMKTMKRTSILIVSASLIGLAGCASDSGQKSDPAPEKKAEAKKDDRPWDQRLTVGMSKDDVKSAMGDPRGTAMNSDGTESWTYSDREKAFIPWYTATGGKIKTMIVNFDKDGKVKSWSSNSAGAY